MVRAQNSPAVKINFFVMPGPNNLLGRFALEKLWPAEYRALRDVANMGSTVASVKSIKIESVKLISSVSSVGGVSKEQRV